MTVTAVDANLCYLSVVLCTVVQLPHMQLGSEFDEFKTFSVLSKNITTASLVVKMLMTASVMVHNSYCAPCCAITLTHN